jgi:phage uncharacterized protein TIGR01671
MREIKFRAWLKEDKKMENVKTMDFTDKTIRCLKKNEFINAYLLRRVSFDDVELMQYTGVKDKNGKEIYEGDIVVLNNIENDNMCIVRYEHSSYRLEGWSLREDLSNVEDRFLEVVGNIYENKNLLEENN